MADPRLKHSSTTAPQPNLTCLLVGHHLCSGPASKGLDILLLKAIEDNLGACCQAFFTGAKQEAAENPMSISF